MCVGGDTDLGVWLCLDDTATLGVGGVVVGVAWADHANLPRAGAAVVGADGVQVCNHTQHVHQ